ncbi:hypothetical protein Bca4012_084074 [Brassica carinata]
MDNVWQRIDSRYASREDYRRDHRHAPRDLKMKPHQKETYNKRRYEESFASSRQREEEKKATSKQQSSKKGSEEEQLPSTSCAKQPVRPRPPLTATIAMGKPQEERSITFSPEHVRERSFKLNIHSNSYENHKLKKKASDLETTSEEGSSAKKALTFDVEKSAPLCNPHALPPLIPAPKTMEKEKSWYEQTQEEPRIQEMVIKPIKAVEKTVDVVDPDAEKILEEEDWMVNADNYDDNVDLMEDDDLLVDDLEQEESSPAPVKLIAKDDLTLLEESHKGLKISSSPVQDRRSEASPAQTPSSRARPSPAKKKRGSPSPIAAEEANGGPGFNKDKRFEEWAKSPWYLTGSWPCSK